MQWNNDQQKAIKAVNNWLKNPNGQQVFRLFGHAGTGKTTLAKHIAELSNRKVLFAAYTGKAAYVLQQKGCSDAQTIHSLIYVQKSKSEARYKKLEAELLSRGAQENPDPAIMRELRAQLKKEEENLRRPAFSLNADSPLKSANMLIVDECSMVDERMGNDLLSYNKPILVLGDPFQLPPVGSGGFFTDQPADYMLREVVRQASDNPVLAMATLVRENRSLPLGTYGSSEVLRGRPDPDRVMAHDQILTGKNSTRSGANRRVRSLLGIDSPIPVVGDRVVCLRNDYDEGVLNGSLWKTTEVSEAYEDQIIINLEDPETGDRVEDLICHLAHFQGRGKDLNLWVRKEAQEFDYGYALTVHKAQGSQWGKVMIFDEGYVFREHRWRWLYTAITRASESVMVVRT